MVVVLLAGFAAALLRKSLLQGQALLGYDLFAYFFPAKAFAARAVHQGHLPLWNPDIFTGAPFLANVQMAALYPPDVLFYVLSFARAVAVSQWLHLTIAGTGLYVLARVGWGLRPLSAALGALTYEGSGFFAAHMGHLNQVHAAAWLPWVALCALRGARAATLGPLRAAGWLVAGGAAVALMLTAGHTQEAYYGLCAVGLLALGYTLLPPAAAPGRWWHLPAFGAVCANGALLSAAQLLPTLELTRLSYRQGGIPLDEAVAYAVERTNILETVLPTFWSLPSQEVTGYVGVAALVLAAAALAASPARRTTVGLAGLAALALVLSMGGYTPLYGVLHRFVPLFSSFRAPGRWVLVSTFALAGLAALGVDALRWSSVGAARERRALRLGLAVLASVTGLGLVVWRTDAVHAIQWLPHARVAVLWLLAGFGACALALVGIFVRVPWPQALLCGLVAFELSFAAHEAEYNQPDNPALYRAAPAIVPALQDALTVPGTRVLSLAVEERLDPARFGRAVPDGSGEYKHYASMREALKPDLGMVYGLPTIDGYDGGLLPTRDYARLKSLLVRDEPPVPHLTLAAQLAGKAPARLLAPLGVRYVLTDGRNGAPGPDWMLRESAPGAAWLYENALGGGERAWLAERVVVEPDPDATMRQLAGADDLRALALVDRPPEGALPSGSDTGTVRIVSDAPERVVLESTASAPRLLVLADAYYPGWRASVDGAAATILKVDGVFRGVVVPAGMHQVRFWYVPLSFWLGCGVSVLALVGNVVLLVVWRRGR